MRRVDRAPEPPQTASAPPRRPATSTLRALLLGALAMIGLLVATAAPADVPNRRPSDEDRGKELYDRHCFQCHGERGDGQGPATAALVKPVPDSRGKVKVDDATLNLVLRGKGVMPAFEPTFDRADAKRVLQHMRRLSNQADEVEAPEAADEADEPDEGDAAPDGPADEG